MTGPPDDITTAAEGTGESADAWHPDITALHGYWEALRPSATLLPARTDIDPARIVRLLPGIWMLDVQREPFRLRYRLMGTGVVAGHGRDLTGQWFDEAHPNLPSEYFQRYQSVVDTHQPSWRRGAPYLDARRRTVVVLENIILPLAADGSTVDILLCLTRIYGPQGELKL